MKRGKKKKKGPCEEVDSFTWRLARRDLRVGFQLRILCDKDKGKWTKKVILLWGEILGELTVLIIVHELMRDLSRLIDSCDVYT